ncbi:dNA mismatch repair protein MutL [Prevotella sp. CAG:891]|nr:dNA mismatch repair protein MutL [Prevotella sp. CAG:891]
MSDIIQLLPDSVANQIAAGEVIQRPASIIKELVENSLDAGASHIQVVVEDAGKTLVQVIDNGSGMSATDARLSFERHATSKIKKATDLFALRTMGFRGEALASIAAVAQVELRTRKEGEELGTSICIEGSKLVSQEAISCPIGANFAVKNLFFNIPARRKFLKSNQTELTNILTEFERIALAHPEVKFTIHSAQSVLMDLPQGNFRQRIVSIFGRKIDAQLVPIHTDTTLAKIKGFVGTPTASKKKNAHQYMFVNGRYMRHPYFAKAIQTAYDRLIPEGQQVPFFINFEVDPARIDVNIHPTKTEIKFEDDSAIFQILLASVREALGKSGAIPALDFDVEGRPDIPPMRFEGESDITPPQIHINTSFNPFATENPFTTENADRHVGKNASKGNYQGNSTFDSSFERSGRPAVSHNATNWQQVYDEAKKSSNHLFPDDDTLLSTQADNKEQESDTPLFDVLPSAEQASVTSTLTNEFLQYHGRYIVTPLNAGLALIDQHRAHTRIIYERLMRQLKTQQAPSQRLLFPEMLTVPLSEAIVLEEIMPQLQHVGFDISPLGQGSFSILAMPLGAEGMKPAELVGSILADAVTGEAQAADTVAHLIAASLAQKIAMPVGQALCNEDMKELTEQLFTCQTPQLTPNGLPTIIMLNPENMF